MSVAKGVRCGICRRQSFMPVGAVDGGVCVDCYRALDEDKKSWSTDGEEVEFDEDRVMRFAAKRAWEFSDAITDATTFGHRSGDPGPSPPHARSRRRR